MALAIPSRALAVPITIEVHPTQVASLNYQIYYNGEKYMKDLEFYITNMKSRSSMVVKSSNSYLYVETIIYGDYKIEVEAEDFGRVYTLKVDEKFAESSHKTKKLDLDKPSGELKIEFVPESEQYIPPSGNDTDDDNDDHDDGDDGNDDLGDSNEEGNSSGGNSTDDLGNGDSSLDGGTPNKGETNNGDSNHNIFIPITGSPFNVGVVASAIACIFLWKGVSLVAKKNKKPGNS